MTKLYIYFAVLIIVIGFIKWYSNNQYDAGYNAHKAEVADKKDEVRVVYRDKVKEIIKWRIKVKKEYVTKIKYIDSVKDTTGCADVKYTDMGFGLQ